MFIERIHYKPQPHTKRVERERAGIVEVIATDTSDAVIFEHDKDSQKERGTQQHLPQEEHPGEHHEERASEQPPLHKSVDVRA
jgi:hypothetical protein